MLNKQRLEEEFGKPACIILAKKHSSRLPHKNKLLINGKPLYQHAIDNAVESGVFSRIWVSSDDAEILEKVYEQMPYILPEKEKALVTPHKRAKRLAYSTTPIRAVVRFLLLKFIETPIFAVLTPCNPLITPDDIRTAYNLMFEEDARYVISVKEAKPAEYLLRVQGKFIIPSTLNERSQKYQKVYYPDGGIIFASHDWFLREYDYDFKGTKCYPYIVPHPTIDIDTQEEFEYAKYLLEVRNENKMS